MDMDLILSQLVQLDKRATEMVAEATDELEHTRNHMDIDVKNLKESYFKEAHEQIGLQMASTADLGGEATEEVIQKYKQLEQQMQDSYEKNHKRWEDIVFNRCFDY